MCKFICKRAPAAQRPPLKPRREQQMAEPPRIPRQKPRYEIYVLETHLSVILARAEEVNR